MSARTLQFIVPCTLFVLVTGCMEPEPHAEVEGSIEARLLTQPPAYAVEWNDIEDNVDHEKIESIFNEAIDANGARVEKIVSKELAVSFGRAMNEQYEIDGEENNGIRHLIYKEKPLQIIIELLG